MEPIEQLAKAALMRDHSVAGVGDAGVDAEDDHVHPPNSAREVGRLPEPPRSDVQAAALGADEVRCRVRTPSSR